MPHVLTEQGEIDPAVQEEARRLTRLEADRLRRELGLTYRDLAEKSGVSVSLVNRLLSGPGWPRDQQLFRVAMGLGLERDGLAQYERRMIEKVLLEHLAAKNDIEHSVATDGHLSVDLDPSSVEGFTTSEIQEVILGAKKGAVAAINEIHSRRRPFRGLAA